MRRGGIILTASCRLMLPCHDKHKHDARIFISIKTADIVLSLFFFNNRSRPHFVTEADVRDCIAAVINQVFNRPQVFMVNFLCGLCSTHRLCLADQKLVELLQQGRLPDNLPAHVGVPGLLIWIPAVDRIQCVLTL